MGTSKFEESLVVTSAAPLVANFIAAATPRAKFRVGLEQEKLPVRADGTPVPYAGPAGIEALLTRLLERGFVATREDGHPIALARGEERITLEPGGQLELSGPALSTVSACRVALDRHVDEVVQLGRPLGIHFIAGGFQPFGRREDIGWTPKRRYAVMREYLPRHGSLGHDMMKRTATVQANFDFEDEGDAVAKLRAAFGVTSIVTALFAASPLADGRPSGFKSVRAAVWLDMDEARCGLLPFVFQPDFGFAHYVEWALDVPMFFVVRAGVYHPVGDGFTFRRFMRDGWQGERATMADWEVHLSTVFPEVRLKRTIEVRGADAGPMPFARALGALWRGLLDDPAARQATWDLVARAPLSERERLRRAVPSEGLRAEFLNRRCDAWALELCALARDGLSRLPGGREDACLIAPLEVYARAGRCPADDLLDDYFAQSGDPARLTKLWDLGSAA